MLRICLGLVLLAGSSLPGLSQMKASANIGIEEKLGAKVALDVPLKDENAKDVTLRQLIDKPSILMFNYFRCPGICPVLINNVIDVVNQLPLEPGKDFRLIAVSFDPSDSPQLAREKKANYLSQMRRPFTPDAWHFLTGTAENSRTIADSVGFDYQKQGDMYAHPGAIILITPLGNHQSLSVRNEFCTRRCRDGHKRSCGRAGAPDHFKGIVLLLYLRPGRPRLCSQHNARNRHRRVAVRGNICPVRSERANQKAQ